MRGRRGMVSAGEEGGPQSTPPPKPYPPHEGFIVIFGCSQGPQEAGRRRREWRVMCCALSSAGKRAPRELGR